MMVKLLTGLSGIQKWVIIGLAAALAATIAGTGITIYMLNDTIDDQVVDIIELKVDNKQWKDATETCTKSITEQNTAIQALEDEKKLADERAALAAKKAKAIVRSRLAQKGKATAHSEGMDTAEAAIERAKADLEGSLL